jgi:hypothetical protein
MMELNKFCRTRPEIAIRRQLLPRHEIHFPIIQKETALGLLAAIAVVTYSELGRKHDETNDGSPW